MEYHPVNCPPKKGGNAILFQVTTIPNTTALLKNMPSASNNDHVFQNHVIYFHDSMDWFTGNLNRKPYLFHSHFFFSVSCQISYKPFLRMMANALHIIPQCNLPHHILLVSIRIPSATPSRSSSANAENFGFNRLTSHIL